MRFGRKARRCERYRKVMMRETSLTENEREYLLERLEASREALEEILRRMDADGSA